MYTLKDMLRRAVLLNADGAAIVDGDLRLSWSQLVQRIRAISVSLRTLGFKPGDRVAILSANSPRFFELQFAVLWAGGTVVPINTRFAVREIVGCLDDLDGPWIATDDDLVMAIEGVKRSLHGIKGYLFLGRSRCPAGYVDYDRLLQGDPSVDTGDPSTSDLAMIYLTGGTTGVPKGVMLTHGQMLAGAQQWASSFSDLSERDVYLHVAPMFHMADGMMCFTAALNALPSVFLPRFELQAFVDTCNRHLVSCILLVPTMARMLCLHLQATGQSIPSLRLMVYGAAPMPRTILDLVMRTFPTVRLYHGYGCTEALSITILGPEHHTPDAHGERMMRSCGRPFRGVLLSIQDAQRRELPTGAVGEVCIRSNAVMKGYWNKPSLTRDVLVDNWYHSGDAGFLDERGYLTLVDRVKDMLITGGENVYSAEVENVLMLHDAVDECAIIGLPDEQWGEVVHAVIRLKDSLTASAQDLQQFCRQHLAGYKVPKSVEFFPSALPKTPLGKLNKSELKRQIIDRIR